MKKGKVLIEFDVEEARKINREHRQIMPLAECAQFDQAKRMPETNRWCRSEIHTRKPR